MFNYPLKFFLSSTMGFSSPSKRSKIFNLVFSFKRGYDQSEEDEEAELESAPPSPSLVQVPVQYFAVGISIKEKLPVMVYGCGKEDGGGDSSTCAVCLKCMSEGDEVRELGNCCHVFHKECLDGWIDQGQLTCPLCRSKLLPSDDQDEGDQVLKCGGDPWRRERMIYLFGEDFEFQ
ncbi:hypothetical protein RHSIM_Rhsim03G0215800 [Rhododendron simsii]|uniref:RING-type domain-containing protein n=1 Tax=Rhododendron simsii TaxID=118357 RepID=A0A834LUE7_RHOSS|nr:hypothetical protein RHSIM_Rhsim03G0215800 [Rhododendron simsii]